MSPSVFFAAVLATVAASAADGWPDISTPATVSRVGRGDAALVIAIEDYAFAQDIPGAVQNGTAWVNWLKSGHGVSIVKPLFNHQAVRESMLSEVARVATRVEPGGRLWVVYIGHGAPSEAGDDGLLVGADAQQTPASLASRSLERGALLAAAEAALPEGAEVVMVQDACFSGRTATGDLAPGMAPLKTVTARLGPRTSVLSAAASDEYAGPLSDGSRPAFSYLVLGALRGWGDRNGDGRVSAEEAVFYADDALLQTTTGRSQSPELRGPDVALGRAGRERAPDLTGLALAGSLGDGAPTGEAGRVQVELGGDATDFEALSRAAVAARQAREAAETDLRSVEKRLADERERRLDAAVLKVQEQAGEDYRNFEALLREPSPELAPVLEAWMKRYRDATVTVDGVTREVAISELERVAAVLTELRAEVSASASDGTDADRSGEAGEGGSVIWNPIRGLADAETPCPGGVGRSPWQLGIVGHNRLRCPVRTGLSIVLVSTNESDRLALLNVSIYDRNLGDRQGLSGTLVSTTAGDSAELVVSPLGVLPALYTTAERQRGLYYSLLNRSSQLDGVHVGLVNIVGSQRGLQASPVNATETSMTGVSTGALGIFPALVNTADVHTGLQFGLFNRANELRGVQIGLINIDQSGRKIPLINPHLKQARAEESQGEAAAAPTPSVR